MKSDEQYLTHFEMFLLTEKRVSKNTFSAYKQDLQQLMVYLKSMRIGSSQSSFEKCTHGHLKKFLKSLKDQGLTAKSLSRKISTFKSFFTFLHENFDVQNKADGLIFPKLEKTLPIYLTEEEIQKIFVIANQDNTFHGVRNKVMLSLLYASGMRVSELVNTKISNIHFDSGFINIWGKGDKERMVPLPQSVLDLIQHYLDSVYQKFMPKKSLPDEQCIYLFPAYYGGKMKAISRQLFWGVVKKILAKSDIKKRISPHSFRHSLATHLLKKGANIRLLQVLLGHQSITTVEIYTHVENPQIRAVYNKKHPRA